MSRAGARSRVTAPRDNVTLTVTCELVPEVGIEPTRGVNPTGFESGNRKSPKPPDSLNVGSLEAIHCLSFIVKQIEQL